jgi:nucleoside-diphosphate kinase
MTLLPSFPRLRCPPVTDGIVAQSHGNATDSGVGDGERLTLPPRRPILASGGPAARENTMIEDTLILIKPDGLARSLTGYVLSEFSKLDFDIVATKMVRPTRELCQEHYSNLTGQRFYEAVVRYLMGEFHRKKKVMALVYRGEGAVGRIRSVIGDTNPLRADPVTIRGRFGRLQTVDGVEIFENVVHASESPAEAKREIALWFSPDEIIPPVEGEH